MPSPGEKRNQHFSRKDKKKREMWKEVKREMARGQGFSTQAERRQAKMEVRSELVQQWLAESAANSDLGIPECGIAWVAGCTGEATHAHEPRLRSRGGDILDRAECLLTCWPCHSAVHLATGEQLILAYSLGYLKHSWNA
jgi:hypothetical protein